MEKFFEEILKKEIYSWFKPEEARRIFLTLNRIITRDPQLAESKYFFSKRFPGFKISYDYLVPNGLEYLAEKSSILPDSERSFSQGEFFMRIINAYEQFTSFVNKVGEINSPTNIEDKEIDRALIETWGDTRVFWK